MDAPAARFLSAQWLNLAVVNFEIDAAVLAPHVPVGTELDTWQGRSLVSLVGFQFRDTRVWGLSIPFHRHFAEVNLRFYVRRKTTDGWRRGVSFIRELAPRRALAWTARVLYGENYQSVPIRCDVTVPNGDPRAHSRVAYQWRYAGQDSLLELTATGTGATAREGTLEAFIIEHYWGYSGAPAAGRSNIRSNIRRGSCGPRARPGLTATRSVCMARGSPRRSPRPPCRPSLPTARRSQCFAAGGSRNRGAAPLYSGA